MNNRQSLQKSWLIDSTLNHRIDMVCLAILYVGFFSCLIRSDYNFVVAFFCYFVWQTNKDIISLRLMMAALILACIFDFIYIFTELRLWVITIPTNSVWQTIRPMHNFGIFCFVVINLLKILLMLMVGKAIRDRNRSVQTR